MVADHGSPSRLQTRSLAALPGPVRIFAWLSILLAALSWVVVGCARLMRMPQPYSSIVTDPQPHSDFTMFQQVFRLFHSWAFFHNPGVTFAYPAPLAIFYHILFVIWGDRPHSERILRAFVLLVTCIALWFFARALNRRGISWLSVSLVCLILVGTSYPLYYELDRCNVEVIVWAVLLLAFWAFREQMPALAAIFIGTAIAFKYYPAVLLGLFLYPKKYKFIAIALLAAGAVTLLSDAWLGPTIGTAFKETVIGTNRFIESYAQQSIGPGFDHSFLALYKVLAARYHPNLAADLRRYIKIAAVLATALYFLRIRKLPVINQISILLILSITLPPVSFDYTLLHIYICWGIFCLYVIDSARAGIQVPRAGWIMAWFAFTLTSQSYFIHHHVRLNGEAHLLGLIALLCLFLIQPFPEPAPIPCAA